MKDIRAAMKFMNSKIGSNSKIGVVGSSCGVKRAIMLASENENIAALVLMSGGTNKEGLQLVRDSNLPIYCLAAHDDGDGIASQWCDELFLASPNENSRKLIFKTGGHGAELLASQINLNEELVSWFKENLQ